jgi:hypothetical protein
MQTSFTLLPVTVPSIDKISLYIQNKNKSLEMLLLEKNRGSISNMNTIFRLSSFLKRNRISITCCDNEFVFSIL